jgi:pimeloyl-ACP methyl ester carboxylesterase
MLSRGTTRFASIGALITVLFVSALIVASQAASRSGRVTQPPDQPTIVLVHGAWADGSSWDKVARRLQAQGYTVDVPPDPLRGLASDSAYIGSFVDTISGPVVLVGHSYGGAVITNAATSTPNVKALVYINAFAPDQGESILQLVGAQPGSALAGNPADIFNVVPFSGGADLYVKPSVFPGAFANDLPAEEAAVLAATQRPLAEAAVSEPSGPPAWKTIPSWYLVGTADHVLPPAEQEFMAARMHAHTVEVDASHLSMISQPEQVTQLILDAAASVH